MIKYTVMYPLTAGSRFDLPYYLDKHVSMLLTAFGDACKGHEVCKGLSGGAPESPPVYCVTIDLYFDSQGAMQGAVAPHAARLKADIANFTDITPARQISEVVASRSIGV